MRVRTVILKDVFQTVLEMERLAKDYRGDVFPFRKMSFVEFYFYVKKLRYYRDPPNHEFLQRPGSTLLGKVPVRDCDCKAIAIKAYCLYKNIPCRFVATSEMPNKRLHHIYNEILLSGQWWPVDATYPGNKLFKERPYAYKVNF